MKKTSKYLAPIAVLSMAFLFTACGKNSDDADVIFETEVESVSETTITEEEITATTTTEATTTVITTEETRPVEVSEITVETTETEAETASLTGSKL